MTAHTTNGTGTPDDPAIAVYLDDARDTLWTLDFIVEWLDYASADTHDDLHEFCQSRGRDQSIDNVVATIARQATNLRRALTAITREGAAIG